MDVAYLAEVYSIQFRKNQPKMAMVVIATLPIAVSYPVFQNTLLAD